MRLKYILSPTVLYMEDVEAVGGGVLLEEIKLIHKKMQVFGGTLYMCGHHWNVEYVTYKKGKGRIIRIKEPNKREVIEKINSLLSERMENDDCPLLKIKARRSSCKAKGKLLYALSILSILRANISYTECQDNTFLLILLASIAILVSSIHVTNKAVRG